MTNPASATTVRMLIALLTLVQFIHIVDFMMVMPLGPNFTAAIGIPADAIGIVSGAYTFAAALAGFIGALFLDIYSRKRTLLVCLAGLIIATACTALATDLHSMLALRFIAGIFGGPIWGICTAFVADYVPPRERGLAIGKLMGGFSMATVLGLPFGLWLAHMFNWQAPFLVLSAIGLAVLAIGIYKLPYHAPFVDPDAVFKKRFKSIMKMLTSRLVWAGYGCSALAMMAGFMLIPSLTIYWTMNRDYPLSELSILYLVGGTITFFTQRFSGQLVDRTSATFTSIFFSALFALNLLQCFIMEWNMVPVMVTFVLFMVAMSGRGVAAQALASKIPTPAQRGAFMAVQGSMINVATSLGAYFSSFILVEADGKLLHMDELAAISIALTLFVPLLFWYVENRTKLNEH